MIITIVKDIITILRLSAKLIGWMPILALSVVSTLAIVLVDVNPGTVFMPLLEIVLPLMTAVLWVYVVAPSSDPCLEVMLTCKLRLSTIRLTRLVVLLLEVLVVTVIYSVFVGIRSGNEGNFVLLGLALLLPPLLLFMGISGFVTVLSTNPALGLSVVSVVFIACLMMLQIWEYLQSIELLTLVFPFLYNATHSLSGMNRVAVSLIGLVFVSLSLVLPITETGLIHYQSLE